MNVLKTGLYYLNASLNYLFIREKKYRKISKQLFNKYYSNSFYLLSPPKMIIFMTDRKLKSGGLADRLRGIVSVFEYCLRNNIEFKIYFIEPFVLSDYLVPNEYNWKISDNQISYNSHDAYPVFFIPHREKALNLKIETAYQRFVFNRLMKHRQPQLHVYTNAIFGNDNFGILFHKLFKPTEELSKILEIEKGNLGKEYISISTRFLELLGDFTEPEKMRETLDEYNQQKLINGCIAQIETIKDQYLAEGSKILITSDSQKFLNAVKKFEYCYTIDGQISHVETSESSKETHLKTFIDFLLISQAKRAFLLIGPGMYPSNFSQRASQINNIPFSQVKFNL